MATLSSACCSTSGRIQSAASQFSGRALVAARPCSRQRGQRGAPVMAKLFRKEAYKKYMTPEDLELDYRSEWAPILQGIEKRKMTLLSLFLSIPHVLRFYVIPMPIRFVWCWAWFKLQDAVYELRRKAVVAGVKLDLKTLQKRGGTALASYRMVWTALRRLHGKESVLDPLRLAMQR